jgi:hypothetical protein
MTDTTEVRYDAAPRRPGSIAQFALKAIIAAIVVCAATLFLANTLLDRIETGINSVKIGGPAFWGKIERELARAADPSSDLPPEQRERILNNLKTVVARWKPFVDVIVPENQNGAGR